MATYNGARFINAQLDSIHRQRLPPDELVVTDDGSTDGTVALVERFAARARFPVRIYRNPRRLNYRDNFMHNASLCRSDLIAFSDQDDVWHEDKLQRAVVLFNDAEILLVHHDAHVVRDGVPKGERLGKPIQPPPLLEPMTNPAWAFSQGFTQMLDRRLVQFSPLWRRSICRYDQSLPDSHDRWFFFLASVLGRIGFIDRPLADYRQHGQNVFGIPATAHRPVREGPEHTGEPFRGLRRPAAPVGQAGGDPRRHRADGHPGKDVARARRTRGGPLREPRRDLPASPGALRVPRLTARLRHFRSLAARRAYDDRGSWHFGGKALLKDAVLGGVLGPLTLRHGVPARGGDPLCWPGSWR